MEPGFSESSEAISEHNKNLHNKLVCINYPGNVKNVDKMIETLGGMDNIEQAVGVPLKRLELRFRPNNLTCKPAIADKDSKPGILLKVKVPKEGVSSTTDDLNGGLEYEVVGITALTFKFNRLCDYQYLPIATKDEVENKDSEAEYVYDKIIPEELPDLNWFLSEESKNVLPFLVPAMFCRNDSTQNKLHFPRAKFYENRYRTDYAQKLEQNRQRESASSKYIPVPSRNKSYCKSVSIRDKYVPMEPYKSSLIALSSKYVSQREYEKIKKMFEERPIWSRAAVQHQLGVTSMQIRALLSLVGYYYSTGPWRIMWARYGYDPRLDPEARKYQTFDFRIRTSGGLKLGVKAKRNYTSGENKSKKVTLHEDVITKYRKGVIDESHYILKPNMLPPARQMFYQYCDIHIPEIQAMLTRLPPVPPGTKCDEKNGWLPSNFTDQCREIANKYITEHVHTILDEEKQLEKSDEPQHSRDDFELLEISDTEDEDSDNELLEHNIDFGSDAEESGEESDVSEDNNETEVLPANKGKGNVEENEIDLETVKEVNEMLGIQEKIQLPSDESSDDENT